MPSVASIDKNPGLEGKYQRFRDPCPVENLVENPGASLKRGAWGKPAKNEGETEAHRCNLLIYRTLSYGG